MAHIHEDGGELRPPPLVATGRERSKRVAVITLLTRHDFLTLGLSDLQIVLARQFDCGLDCLGPARDKVDAVQIARRQRNKLVSQAFGGVRGEEPSVRKSHLAQLFLNGGFDVRVAVTEARDRRIPTIQVTFSRGVDQVDAFTVRDPERRVSGVSGKHVGRHGEAPSACRATNLAFNRAGRSVLLSAGRLSRP